MRQPGDYVVNAELTNEQRERFVKDCVAAGVDRIFQDCKSHKYTSLMRPLSNLVVGTTFLEGGNHAYWKGYSNNVTHEYKDNAMTHKSEPTWTEWLANPGTGECPVPEFAREAGEYHLRIDGLGDGTPCDDAADHFDWGDKNITHYRYQVPADLAWLAENVSEWKADDKSREYTHILRNTNNPGFGFGWGMVGNGWYTKDQWLRARRDLGYEQAEYPECPPNFRCIKQPNVEYSRSDGSTALYYKLPDEATELQHLISYKNMNAQAGEIFRTCYRYGEASHSEQLRDAKKMRFYAQAEVERLEKMQ